MNRFFARSSVLLALFAATGCVASKSSLDDGANLNAGSSEDTGGTGESTGASSTAGMTSTSGPDTATTGMTTGANPTTATTNDTNDDDNEEESDDDPSGAALDVAVPEGCAGIDHGSCWEAMTAACDGAGSWNYDDPDCVAAVESCYPVDIPGVSPPNFIEACHSEPSDDCDFKGTPEACGAAFCACAVGEYPFDWNNCWHVLLLACDPNGTGDCNAALAGCYPGETPEDYAACYQQVMDGDYECNCPMCGQHDECEASLTECLAG